MSIVEEIDKKIREFIKIIVLTKKMVGGDRCG